LKEWTEKLSKGVEMRMSSYFELGLVVKRYVSSGEGPPSVLSDFTRGTPLPPFEKTRRSLATLVPTGSRILTEYTEVSS